MNCQMNTDAILRLRKKHIGPNVTLYHRQDPLHIVRGEGAYLYDDTGKAYLDCINNVAHVGHSHPEVTKACADQMGLLCTNSRYLHSHMAELGKRIADTMPKGLDVCYFVNSGSEANDLALQIAHVYTGQRDVICMDDAYHGTVRSVQVISPHKWKQAEHLKGYFETEHHHVVPVPDAYRGLYRSSEYSIAELSQKYTQEVKDTIGQIEAKGRGLSAFILESLQSCGGQIIYPSTYPQETFKAVREAGGLVIADEVQTGCGRVGTHWWAFQTYPGDVKPDIVTIGKPLGNGHPVSAVVTTREIADRFVLPYFNTFGGNPVSCAIALSVLDTIEREGLRTHAVTVGEYLLERMRELQEQHELVGDVRGRGLFIGVDLVTNRSTREPATAEAKEILLRLKDEGIILSREGPHENVLKFKPPMCFSKQNVDYVYTKLDLALSELESNGARAELPQDLATLKTKKTSDMNGNFEEARPEARNSGQSMATLIEPASKRTKVC